MAKKKLFGGNIDPNCGTCAHGKLSYDGETVLCEHGGATPAHHHCRRFQYDPLRRTPMRRAPLEKYSPSDFALDTTTEDAEIEVLLASGQEQTDSAYAAVLNNLRTYLNETESPDVQTILAILDDVPDEEPPGEEEPLGEELLTEELLTEEQEAPALIIDDSPDIFEDLKHLTVALDTSSTPAAFRSLSLHLAAEGSDDEESDLSDVLPDTDVLALPSDDTEEDDILSADDLRFLSDSDLQDDEAASVTMNEDGSFSTHKRQ